MVHTKINYALIVFLLLSIAGCTKFGKNVTVQVVAANSIWTLFLSWNIKP
jgi:hypothetical protein